MIRALLIDLDGVVRIWDGRDAREAETRFALPDGTMPQTAFEPTLLNRAVAGEISDEEWRRQVAVRLRDRLSEADATEAVRIWSASAGRIDMDVLDMVRICRRKATVVLVTNGTSRLPADLARLDIADEFDAIVNSSDHGFFKPDPRIYQVALNTADVVAQEALFVDDSPAHVEAAIALGMAGYVYADVASLSVQFIRLGLL